MPKPKVINVVGASKVMRLEGIPQLKKTLKELQRVLSAEDKDALSEQVREALLTPAMMIQDEAITLAPEGQKTKNPGNLKRSIIARKGKRGAVAFVAVDRKLAPYALFVEKGTSKMPASPFFRPAVNAMKPLVAKMIAAGVGPIVKRVAEENAWKNQ